MADSSKAHSSESREEKALPSKPLLDYTGAPSLFLTYPFQSLLSIPTNFAMPLKRFSAFLGRAASSHPEDQYQAPPGPPPNWKPPLLPLHIPQEEESHRNTLPAEGWTKLWLPPDVSAINGLFAASNQFFDLPRPEKMKKVLKLGTTEEGYFRVEGEKEYVTLRRSDDAICPVRVLSSVAYLALIMPRSS